MSGNNEGDRKAQQRIKWARQGKARELDLRDMKLTKLPEAIASLTNLQGLNLNNNQLTELPKAIASLTQLQVLDLSNNKLRKLPNAIASLTQLQKLDLQNNQLSELPKAIASLTQLQELYLNKNQLRELPETIASFTQLQVLDLDNNQLRELPEALASLTQLQKLDLQNNQLTKLPEALASLTQLRELYLQNNQLRELPNAIASLTQLRELFLPNNQLRELPGALASLTQLQWLNLNHNQLRELPETISSLTQLQWLLLDNNQLRELPETISSLTQLQQLYLQNNQLRELPEALTSLTQLQRLFLPNNQLRELPGALASLTQLQLLCLSNNPLNPDLAAAYDQGTEGVLQYLRAKAEAQITLNEAKLILIGEGEVGKSCLLGALREDEWLEGRPTTHGIEIKPVIVTHPDTDTEISLNGWDFGGQPVYRSTHQLFFSAPAVYLVVWKPREGPQQGFVKEWITLIKHREPDAKVLVVATHGGPGQRQPDIDRQEIHDRFGSDTVLGFFHVNSKPDAQNSCTGLAELKAKIASVAASLPEMGRSVPAKWQQVREILQTNDRAYLPYDEVIAICDRHGIDQEQAELFLRISHTLGQIIHYHYDPILRDIVILKPDWLAKAISFVLDDETTRRRNGLVDFEHLGELWSNPPFPGETGYPQELHPIFLKLMERFDLSYRVVLDPTGPSNTSLIAQLVPDTRPKLPNWGQQPEAGDRQQVQICRIVDDRGQLAVAEGLFYQLIVRLHKYSLGRCNYERSIHWQRGLMLDNDYNGRALLEYIDTDVKITVRAAYPERFLSYLTQEIKWLVENFWEGLRCNVMVPCIAPCGKNLPGNGLFEVEKLIESKKKHRDEYPCPISGCGEWQNIDRLLNNAPIAQLPSQEIGIQQFRNMVKDELNIIREDLVVFDRRGQERYQSLSQDQRIILSKVDEEFASLMQMLTDEAKDGPRLFSFKPIDPKFFDRPKWISTKFQITLWCEHSRQPLPALNPNDKQKGIYELQLSREWFTKVAPYLKFVAVTLSLFLPVAASATKVMLDETTYKGIKEELELGQKSIESTLKASYLAANWFPEKAAPDWQKSESVMRSQGLILRELHALLKAKDPGFGGLVRVQNRRREFLWVHEQFVDEY
jgi:Leucine-rich repeat (LRR) protein